VIVAGGDESNMPRRNRTNVGVIGLGIIGSRVAENLRRQGFHVFVWNRTPRPVPNFVGGPGELAEMCDHVAIFVSDDDALLEVVKQMGPALAPRHIVLAHSTVSPYSMRAAADIVERRGARFLEAPFTGSKMAAEKGELVYYVAGDDAALQEARPILEASSKEIIAIGEIGQATIIKVATNIVTAASVQAAAEALALLQVAGLSLEKFTVAMRENASNSETLSMKLPKIIEGDFEAHFSLKHMLKDMQIANRLGLLHHLELAVTAAARDRLVEQMQRGYGDKDYSAVARKYFPDVRSADREEADLELFAKSTLPEPSVSSSDNEGVTAPGQVVDTPPISEGAAKQEPQPVETQTTPAVKSADNSAESEKQKPEVQNESAAPPEAIAQPVPGEEVDEAPPPRGLFFRLLSAEANIKDSLRGEE